jgi:hypothetical protein
MQTLESKHLLIVFLLVLGLAACKKESRRVVINNCPIPIGMQNVSIGATQATVKWSVLDPREEFYLEFRDSGSLNWQPWSSTSPVHLTYLTPGTTYEWRVKRPFCDTDYSDTTVFSTKLMYLLVNYDSAVHTFINESLIYEGLKGLVIWPTDSMTLLAHTTTGDKLTMKIPGLAGGTYSNVELTLYKNWPAGPFYATNTANATVTIEPEYAIIDFSGSLIDTSSAVLLLNGSYHGDAGW